MEHMLTLAIRLHLEVDLCMQPVVPQSRHITSEHCKSEHAPPLCASDNESNPPPQRL